MKNKSNTQTFKRGDKLDLLLLFLVTLFVGLITLSNVSIPALTGIDSSKTGITFFNLGSLSYFKEIPLSLIFTIPLGVVSLGLIVLLMLRRKNKEVVSNKKRLIVFFIFIAVLIFYAVATLFLIPDSNGEKITSVKLIGESSTIRYNISFKTFDIIYRISYIISLVTFGFYLYFLLFFLRSFNYCLKSFIKYSQILVIIIAIAFFFGVFLNSSSQNIIISNFNSLLGKSSVSEVTHPIISNSLLGFSVFVGCLSASIMYYRRPGVFTYIISILFMFSAFLTGNVYSLPLCALVIVLTNVLVLFNSKKRIKSVITSLAITVLFIAFIILSATALKSIFGGVNTVITNFIPQLRATLKNDIYLWKVSFSSVLFLTTSYSGLSPYIFTPLIFKTTELLSVVNSPVGSSGNMYIQTFGYFGFIGLALLLLAYVYIIVKCILMIKNKKKSGLYYLIFTLVIIFSSLFYNYGLFSFSPLSMLITVCFIFPLSSEYNKGLIVSGKNDLRPGEIKEVEHKYVRYDVQVDDIKQDSQPSNKNLSFKDAEYAEDKPDLDEEIQELHLPTAEKEEFKNDDEVKKKLEINLEDW